MTNKTLYIPRVFNNITEARIADIFENKACFGQISKIDLVTKEKYKSAYIHFANWKDNDATRAFQKEMDENGKAKVTYEVPWFWIVLEYKKKIPMSTPENSPTLRGVPAAPKKQITQKALMRGFARRNLTGDFDNITKEKEHDVTKTELVHVSYVRCLEEQNAYLYSFIQQRDIQLHNALFTMR